MNLPCPAPHLHTERCNNCGLCAEACSRGVLVLEDSQLRVHPERECDGCGTCEQVCAQDALDYPFEIVWADDEKKQSERGGD